MALKSCRKCSDYLDCLMAWYKSAAKWSNGDRASPFDPSFQPICKFCNSKNVIWHSGGTDGYRTKPYGFILCLDCSIPARKFKYPKGCIRDDDNYPIVPNVRSNVLCDALKDWISQDSVNWENVSAVKHVLLSTSTDEGDGKSADETVSNSQFDWLLYAPKDQYRRFRDVVYPASKLTIKEYSNPLLDGRSNRILWKADRYCGKGEKYADIAADEKLSVDNVKQIISRGRRARAKGYLGIWAERTARDRAKKAQGDSLYWEYRFLEMPLSVGFRYIDDNNPYAPFKKSGEFCLNGVIRQRVIRIAPSLMYTLDYVSNCYADYLTEKHDLDFFRGILSRQDSTPHESLKKHKSHNRTPIHKRLFVYEQPREPIPGLPGWGVGGLHRKTNGTYWTIGEYHTFERGWRETYRVYPSDQIPRHFKLTFFEGIPVWRGRMEKQEQKTIKIYPWEPLKSFPLDLPENNPWVFQKVVVETSVGLFPVDDQIIRKYRLRPGQRTPFTGYRLLMHKSYQNAVTFYPDNKRDTLVQDQRALI